MLFENFEEDPDDFVFISKNLKNNPQFWHKINEYGVKEINIEKDKIVYKVLWKNYE